MNRAEINASFDRIFERLEVEIQAESARSVQALIDQTVKSKRLGKHVDRLAQIELESKKLEKEEKDIGETLKKHRLALGGNGKVGLDWRYEQDITKRLKAAKSELHKLRDDIQIRLPLATPEERVVMVKKFYHEVRKRFPALAPVIGKID